MTTAIFGAGFSRAISNSMPTTVELGRELRRADSDPTELARIPEIQTGADLERWLSRIAEAQPFLDDIDNALGKVDFISATRVIRGVLSDKQDQAMKQKLPEWLRTLVRYLHTTGSSVITFNYDTLLEQATCSVLTEDLSSQYGAPVQPEFRGDRMPLLAIPPRRGHAQVSYVQEPSFSLVKLHGSIDAWWVPGDETGATIGTFRPQAWGSERRPEQWDPDLQPAGREPFIIPPVSSKSPFYRNPITRHLWRDAAHALAAERVSIVGYSVPMTDLTTASMLEHALGRLDTANSANQIDVVDINASLVKESLTALGVDESKIHLFEGVSDWVEDLIDTDLNGQPPAISPYGEAMD
ncbi:hypothetical protein ACQ3I4_13645 [Zafaria sp. Z1313]|uniref:hypothetical protein n=1 Tax=Zafaria sp. Z1313 TaxID=3423202 RepID=UPI003D303389